MKIETATNAKIQFGRLLDEAILEPIVIERARRKIAVILSFYEYEKLLAAEDKYWAEKARSAEKDGFIGVRESEKLIDGLLNAED